MEMKSLVRRAMVICLFTTLTGTVTFAKSTKSNVTLSSDTVVNGTVVKKGMYRVVCDEPSSQLSIFKGSKLIAKTAARLEKSDRKARFTEFLTVLEGMDQR